MQIFDTSAGWWPIHQRLKKDSATKDDSKFSNEIWNDLATQYGKIKSYPLKNSIFQYNWEHIARFASNKQIATNSVYLARIDENKVSQSNQNFIEALKTRNFDKDAIYILDDSLLVPALMYMRPQEDLLAIIPNFLTFIPNKNLCNACPKIPKEWLVSYSPSKIRASNYISFDSSNPYLIPLLAGGHGWERQDGLVFIPRNKEVKLVMPIGDASDRFLDLNFEYPKGEKIKPSSLDISIDGKSWQGIHLINSTDTVILPIPISELSMKDGFISVSLKKPENQDAIKLRLVFAKFR
ncbi:MAG: hypothetical protein HQ456_01445 [Polynucleobacter sp.]|nr:hypothetical protein [Polynucleobacter sp.]